MIILFKKVFFCFSQSDFNIQKNIHMNENTKMRFEAKLTTHIINMIKVGISWSKPHPFINNYYVNSESGKTFNKVNAATIICALKEASAVDVDKTRCPLYNLIGCNIKLLMLVEQL